MIEEDYVSIEIVELLKEKGFDSDECEVHYDPYNHQEYEITFQMAMKWLREVHKLEITPFHEMFQGNSWWYRIERNTSLSLLVEYEEDSIYGSYEQACEMRNLHNLDVKSMPIFKEADEKCLNKYDKN